VIRMATSPGTDTRHLTYDYAVYAGRDWRFFEVMLDRMRPVAPVLDVGSGLGLFVECCARRGVSAVGVELSREGVEESARRHLPVVRADSTLPLPFRDDSFGSAMAHHVLEHVPLEKERAILREVRRVLRPGGFLFAVSPNIFHPQARENPDHVNLFTPHQLRDELRAAGYRRVSLSTNFWRPVWEPRLHLGSLGLLLSGALWKVAPIDRWAGSASAMAWK
jgi:SAM-dependent methyltransferase